MTHARPAVGLLYNPASPDVIARAGSLVEYFAVMPDRMWFDFGAQAPRGKRFHRALGALAQAHQLSQGRLLAAHGIGLSLPSAMPLDEAFVDAIAAMSRDLGGFRWFSEHLSVFLTPKGSVPNAQAGLGLPVVYDDEAFGIVAHKLRRLKDKLGCPLLLENGAFFTPVPDMDMTETAFLNRLHAAGLSGTLLDIHNLYVSQRNDGISMADYLDAIDPAAVQEIHLAGGDDFAGFYMDSHSGFTPPEVWEMAFAHAPRFPNLRAITFEFQETYYERMGVAGVIAELERMHELADLCHVAPGPDGAAVPVADADPAREAAHAG
jgi:uncharacterized protein (UPF0276 family)